MYRLLSIVTFCVALLALVSPSVATGFCLTQGGPDVAVAASDGSPASLPNPCEMQGGKRILPSRSDFSRVVTELPRATLAQWARGLADQPLRDGLAPAAELPPPRRG